MRALSLLWYIIITRNWSTAIDIWLKNTIVKPKNSAGSPHILEVLFGLVFILVFQLNQLFKKYFLKVSQFNWDNLGIWEKPVFLLFHERYTSCFSMAEGLKEGTHWQEGQELSLCLRLLTDYQFYSWVGWAKVSSRPCEEEYFQWHLFWNYKPILPKASMAESSYKENIVFGVVDGSE